MSWLPLDRNPPDDRPVLLGHFDANGNLYWASAGKRGSGVLCGMFFTLLMGQSIHSPTHWQPLQTTINAMRGTKDA